MSERRSDRSRKQVDYSKFIDGGQDDNDFEDCFAASKKKKTTNKENNKVKKVEKKPAVDKNAKVEKKKERPNPKDKLFDNELQIALEVSLSETPICSQPKDVSQDENAETKLNDHPVLPPKCPEDKIILMEENVSDDPTSKRRRTASGNKDHPVLPLKCPEDEIILIEENVSDDPPSKRRRTASGNNKDDQDYTAEDISDTDDDDDDEDFDVSNDENDSDFDCEEHKKMSKKKTKVSKKAQPETPKSKSKIASTPKGRAITPGSKLKTTPVRTPASVPRTVPRTATVSPTVGVAARKQTWNPPNTSESCKSPLGSISVKSPNSGIRIGLSRNQRVKPLHPSLKVQP